MCRQYFEATVNINQQYDVFELYLDKHFCSDTNPDFRMSSGMWS